MLNNKAKKMDNSICQREEDSIRMDRLWAVILAGGLGTRLRPVLDRLPKVMAPVQGRPFLSFVLDWLQNQGLANVVLCTGYKGQIIEDYYGDRYGQLRLFYSREKKLLGTAGALGPAARMVASDMVLVTNGDSLCAVDLDAFYRFTVRHKARAALVTTYCNNSGRFGSVCRDQQGRVSGFAEKTGLQAGGWINAGIYLMKTEILAGIGRDAVLSMEHDLLPSLVGRGLFAYQSKAAFIDIGVPEDYYKAAGFFTSLTPLPGAGRRHADQVSMSGGEQ